MSSLTQTRLEQLRFAPTLAGRLLALGAFMHRSSVLQKLPQGKLGRRQQAIALRLQDTHSSMYAEYWDLMVAQTGPLSLPVLEKLISTLAQNDLEHLSSQLGAWTLSSMPPAYDRSHYLGQFCGHIQRAEDHFEPHLLVALAMLDLLVLLADHPDVVSVVALFAHRQLHQINPLFSYASIHCVLAKQSESFEAAVAASTLGWQSGEHDVSPWLEFILGVFVTCAQDAVEHLGTLETERGSKTEAVLMAIREQVDPFSISDILAACPGASRELVRRLIRRCRDAGEIVVSGPGRGAKWSSRAAGGSNREEISSLTSVTPVPDLIRDPF